MHFKNVFYFFFKPISRLLEDQQGSAMDPDADLDESKGWNLPKRNKFKEALGCCCKKGKNKNTNRKEQKRVRAKTKLA